MDAACGVAPVVAPGVTTAGADEVAVALVAAPAAALAANALGFNRSAICAALQRVAAFLRNAFFAISRKGSFTVGGTTGSAFSLNGRTAGCCVSISTSVKPSDHTSALCVYGDPGISGAS